MLTTSATVLAGLLGAALIFMGGRAFTTPQAAVGFGIPDTPADDPAFRPWLRVKGLREIACGRRARCGGQSPDASRCRICAAGSAVA
jgi:hypothetical protein